MPPRLDAIDHIHVLVADRPASERGYGEVLGFSRVSELAFWSAGGGPLTIANPEGTVHLALFEPTPEGSCSTIAFGVDAKEFCRWQAHLGAVLGRGLKAEDHEVSWSLYCDDPDGKPFEITSYEHEAIERALAPRAA
jgi:catechol-2,3-dioxygenase